MDVTKRRSTYIQIFCFGAICSFLVYYCLNGKDEESFYRVKSLSELFLQTMRNHSQSCFMKHITILVSDIEKAKSWYETVLPIHKIERNIKTATKGAWYRIKDIELHLLERKDLVGMTTGGRITGQHIGLHLGPIGDIREKLYRKGIEVTLAPENDKGQQAMFVMDDDIMTLECTDVNKRKGPMKLLSSSTTLSPKLTNIHLNRPSATRTSQSLDNKPYKFAISSGSAFATAAGNACLQIGGSAADAAIASASVLSVVEPFNGGLGGDFVAMVYNPLNDNYSVLNGSGRSPKQSMPLSESDQFTIDGPLSAMTVPGTAAAWCELHQKYGKLPWDLILQPAIMLAAEGFLVSNRTAQIWESGAQRIIASNNLSDAAKDEFMTMFAPPGVNGTRMTPRAGERFYNPTLGSTLQKLADGNCKWFYEHAAKEIVSHIQSHGGYQGSPDLGNEWQEIHSNHATWEEPISTVYTTDDAIYEVMSLGGNSQAGSALMILNTLNTTISHGTKTFDEVLHKHISAKRIIYRDTFRQPYTQQLIDNSHYTNSVREEMKQAFQNEVAISLEKAPIEESHDTEGLVVRDTAGLTISLLQSISLPFGSGIIVPSLGLPIHNRAFGFTTKPSDKYCFGASKRPWTTLSPYMVKRNKKFWMAASVKGGDRQPYSFTQVFLNIVEHKLSPEDAVSYPRFREKSHHVPQDTSVEFDLPPYIPSDGNKLDISEFHKRLSILKAKGYVSEIFVPQEIEDSGFGVAQVILDDTIYSDNGSPLFTRLTAVSDIARKPGLSLIGEQSQPQQKIDTVYFSNILHPRDLMMLTEPLTLFYNEKLL